MPTWEYMISGVDPGAKRDAERKALRLYRARKRETDPEYVEHQRTYKREYMRRTRKHVADMTPEEHAKLTAQNRELSRRFRERKREDNNKMYYGISIKPGDLHSARVHKFRSRGEAEEWVKTEEYDFREREINEDPEYIWNEYADYLPGRDEMESLDDIIAD